MGNQKIEKSLSKAIRELGAGGATITAIEKRVSFERHTISKYLAVMENQGLVRYEAIGKAKVWHLNKTPIHSILNNPTGSFGEQVLGSMINNMPFGLIVIDNENSVIFMNKTMTETYGNCVGDTFSDKILGRNHKLTKISRIIEGRYDNCDFVLPDRFGSMLAIKATKINNPGDSVAIVLNIEDISELREQEENIQKQKNLLEAERQALNNSAIVAETDLKGNITYANDMFVKISGYSREELIGKNHRIIKSDEHNTAYFRKLWKTIATGKVWKGIIRNRAKDGTSYWVDSTIAPVLGKHGKPVKYIAIRFDLTQYMKK